MDIQELLHTLPHRYPFLLVDRITLWESGKRAHGYKNVTINEPFFEGHFPGRPIMPGVLIIEAMAQVAATLAMRGHRDAQVLLLGVDDYRVRKPVVPGDKLEIEVDVTKVKGAFWRFKGAAKVDGAAVAEGAFLAAVTHPDGSPLVIEGAPK
ncbi:MAG TPA: 3-hydroxyacyl-ACP dehydratase FabZ [bacterium]|nr:3-hydroxyacyl-ACP dehydratase FabZ [bacterium]